jgi:hypothetical protein
MEYNVSDKVHPVTPIRQEKWQSVDNYWKEHHREEEERKKQLQHQAEERRKKQQQEEEERKRKLQELREIFCSAREGDWPLDYMLRVMRDPTVPDARRDDMAKAAAPYIHTRRIPMNTSGEDLSVKLSALTDDELRTFIEFHRKMHIALARSRSEHTRKGNG